MKISAEIAGVQMYNGYLIYDGYDDGTNGDGCFPQSSEDSPKSTIDGVQILVLEDVVVGGTSQEEHLGQLQCHQSYKISNTAAFK